MAHSRLATDQPVLARVGTLVAGSTVVLTLALFGLISFATGEAAGVSGRVPFYVLGAAVTFAAAVIGLDRRTRDGRDLLFLSLGIAVVAFCFVTLGLEGVAYAIRRPGQALASRQFLYLLSTALVVTGLGYWGLNHWKELAKSIQRSAR